MSCLLATGAPCALLQSPRPDVFELHVTIAPRAEADLTTLAVVCRREGWKALVIDVGSEQPRQPMTCQRVVGALDDAHRHAALAAAVLAAAGLEVVRTKIEAAPWNDVVPRCDPAAVGAAYFEYHAKLLLPPSGWTATLLPICDEFGAHLSRNALRRRPDGAQERFTTLRSYTAGLDRFTLETTRFAVALGAAGFSPLSAVTEYCVYDTNQALDAG